MAQIIMLLPILGILVLLWTPRTSTEQLWRTGLWWSMLTLTGTIIWWGTLDKGGSYQTISLSDWVPGMESSLGTIMLACDGVSIFMVILSALLIPICILISASQIRILVKEFIICLLIVEVLLIGVFTVLDLVVFYVLFEGTLIPMFIIIGVWGSRGEKVEAAYYFFLYTFAGSVLMLLGMITLYTYAGTTDYRALCSLDLDWGVQVYVFAALYLGMAVKLPQVPFHIWLPKAHVEAPVSGSVLLAGVLLKLGGYGLVRFTWPMLPAATEFYSPLVVVLSIIGVIYASLTTLRQVDLKRLIAYSSVAHMGLVTLSLFSQTLVGLTASVFMMLAHGLISPALFIAVTILYDRYKTRLVKYYRGMVVAMPLYSLIFMVLILSNASIPLSCGFVGEFLSLLAAYEYSVFSALLASSGIVLSAGYSLYVYNRVCFGVFTKYATYPRDINRQEYYSILPLVVLIILLGVFPWIVMDDIKATVGNYE